MTSLRWLFGVGFILFVFFSLGGVSPARAADVSAAEDFAATAQALGQVIACTPGAKPAEVNISIELHKRYCSQLTVHAARYLKRYHQHIEPVLNQVVPQTQTLPVVYPFGGGDLLTALGTFANATEFTTLSLEAAGDIRGVAKVPAQRIEGALVQTGDNLRRLLAAEHSKTTNLSSMAKGLLPAEIAFSLFAVNLWGFEVVGFRYFDLDPDGRVNYWGAEDFAARDKQIATRKLKGGARAGLFPHVEIAFRRPGETQLRVFRHLAGNLADRELRKDDRILRHLRAKGKVLSMTKAASYLLWWDGFGMIRDYLADASTFMISDSTGLPPQIAKQHGFSQTTYGWFAGPFLPGANRKIAAAFAEQWKTQPTRPIRFHYGYPDVQGRGHMLVMRREDLGR